MTSTTAADFFWKPESNKVHPSTLPSNSQTVEVPVGLSPWEMVTFAREAGANISLGSSRTGVHEIQTDEGIWTRTSANRRAKSDWSFITWDDLEANEAA